MPVENTLIPLGGIVIIDFLLVAEVIAKSKLKLSATKWYTPLGMLLVALRFIVNPQTFFFSFLSTEYFSIYNQKLFPTTSNS